MIATISILAAALLGMVGLLAFAPMAEFRRRGLKAVLVTASITAGLAMGVCFAAFVGLMLSGNHGLSRLSMHALMAAIAMPMVVGLATLAFGAMSVTWRNAFERPNDQFAATIYVLIGLGIVITCASGSLKTDWPGYLIAAMVVPLMPTMINRRICRSRQPGFGSEVMETDHRDRSRQKTATRWAEPVIAPRAPKAPIRPAAAAKPAITAKPHPASANQSATQTKSPAARVRAAANAPVRRTEKSTTTLKKIRGPAITRTAIGLPSKTTIIRVIKKLRHRAAAMIAPTETASPAAARPGVKQGENPRSNGNQSRPQIRNQSIAAVPAPTLPPLAAAPPAARKIEAAKPASPTIPVQSNQHVRTSTPPEQARPSLFQHAITSAPARTKTAAVSKTNDHRKSTDYPLVAAFEPGSDRWATFIDGTLTTETGIVRKVAVRSTQTLEDVSGAA